MTNMEQERLALELIYINRRIKAFIYKKYLTEIDRKKIEELFEIKNEIQAMGLKYHQDY